MNLYMMITGGGTEAISLLTKRGGASAFFRGAQVPYSHEELEWTLGSVTKAVSVDTCRAMLDTCQIALYSYVGDKIAVASTSQLVRIENEREERENYAIIGCSINGEQYFLRADFTKGEEPLWLRVYQENNLSNIIRDITNALLNKQDFKQFVGDYSDTYGYKLCLI